MASENSDLLLIYAYVADMSGGAMVFRGVDSEHVEAFVGGNPYVEAGLVTSHRVERWNLV
jgi:uncharacterized protein YciI